jgi:hypothetical protein
LIVAAFCSRWALSASCPSPGWRWPGRAQALSSALIAAAWRGPNPGDTYYAGVLAANWESKKLEIRYATALPTRPHGLLPEADGGLLVTGVRPGSWLLRCDGNGEVTQQINLEERNFQRPAERPRHSQSAWRRDLHHRNRQQKRSRQDRRAR